MRTFVDFGEDDGPCQICVDVDATLVSGERAFLCARCRTVGRFLFGGMVMTPETAADLRDFIRIHPDARTEVVA